MKMILMLVAILGFAGCVGRREIQADFVNARLVRIDTISRWNDYEQRLTWHCSNNVQMYSFVPMNNSYIVGAHYKVLLAR